MESILQDLRYGIRMLLKSPGFALVAILSLALGIGANTTIFSIVNAVFLRALPIAAPERVMAVYGSDENNTGNRFDFMPISYPNYQDYRDRSSSFEGLALYGGAVLSLSGSGEPERINGQIVSGNYFDILGIKPLQGRFFLPDEYRTDGSHPVIVLGHGFWQRRFGGEKNLVGQQLTLNNLKYTVIGIAPENFRGTFAIGQTDFWVPLQMHDQIYTGTLKEFFNSRRALLFNIFGRLKPQVSITQAELELKSIAKQLEQEHPRDNEKRSVKLLPISDAALDPNTRANFVTAGLVLMAVVGLVLLIACANIANLMLSRAAGRRTEIAIRLALGADRLRLFQQLLTESLLISCIGGLVGLFIALWSRDLLWAYRPAFLRQNDIDFRIDLSVLAFTLGISLLTGLIFGLAPALQLSKPDLVQELKYRTIMIEGTRRIFSLRNSLVIAQVALSLMALIGAGLFLKSLDNAQKIDPGFLADRLAVVQFNVAEQGYDEPRGLEFYRQVEQQTSAIPGVKSATLAANGPMTGGFQRSVFLEGHETEKGILVLTNSVTPSYFQTLGMPLVKGREINDADKKDSLKVVVVNETMAQRFWPNQDALGQRFKFFGDEGYRQVVGIVKDAKYLTLGEDPRPCAFMPMAQGYVPGVTLIAQVNGDPSSAIATLRQQLQLLNNNLPLFNTQTATTAIEQDLWAPRMSALLLGSFGIMALLLAAIGIYGVLSYSVHQRSYEIGIRMALGAQQFDVLRLIMGQALTLVTIGVAIGLIAGFLLSRLFANLLYGVNALEPLAFLGTPLILLIVALLASYLPARRATKVDPIIALRCE